MDRITRKQLKGDKFALEVTHTVEYVAGHRSQVARYGLIGAAVLVLGVGSYFYLQRQHTLRQEELRAALQIQEANVGPSTNEYVTSFPTQEEKDKAELKAFNELAAKHPSSDEGAIAHYYLGTYYADKGNLAEAEKHMKAVVDAGSAPYASLAKLSLAQIYSGQGKQPEAEALLRSVIAKPTVLVSKEQATIALAHLLAPTKPQEARNLLDPLRSERSSVSRVAITALGELSQK